MIRFETEGGTPFCVGEGGEFSVNVLAERL
jgi:hypothetical protein